MEQDFYSILKEIHKDKIRDEYWQEHNINNLSLIHISEPTRH